MKRIVCSRLTVRMFGLAVAIAMLVGTMPAGTFAAQERGGGSYTSPTYDFTVEWDDTIWSAEETADTEGVEFNSALSYGFVQAIPDYAHGAESCLADSAANIEGKENIADFASAPKRMQRPASNSDMGELFTYVNTDNGVEIALYIECQDLNVNDAVLQIMFLGFIDDYEDAVPTWEDLLLTVQTGRESNSGADEGTNSGKIGKGKSDVAEIDGNAYTNPEFGFTSTWDEDAWTPELLTGEEDFSTGFAVAGDYSYAMLMVEELQVEFEECAIEYAERIGSWEDFTKFRKATKSFDLPRSADEAVGALYTYVDNTDPDNPVKVIAYFECRLLPDETNVLITLLVVDPKLYGDELPLWEDLLAGIEIGGANADDKSDKGDDSGEDQTEIEGTTFVGPYFGFALTYDDQVWTAEDLSDGGNDFLDLSSELAIGTVIAFDAPYDGAGCIETLASLKQGEGVTGFDVAPGSYDRPRTVRGADAELFVYTFEGQNGPVDVLTYIECRELADGAATLGISLSTVPAVYEDALIQFETLIAGIDTATP